jgi:hypothetical protein
VVEYISTCHGELVFEHNELFGKREVRMGQCILASVKTEKNGSRFKATNCTVMLGTRKTKERTQKEKNKFPGVKIKLFEHSSENFKENATFITE